MSSAERREACSVHPGYRVVPLHRDEDGVPFGLCVVVKESADPIAGAFVLLRDLADASVYLGCTVDDAGTVHDWLEIWVQNIDRFAAAFPACRDASCNRFLDGRWAQRADAFMELD